MNNNKYSLKTMLVFAFVSFSIIIICAIIVTTNIILKNEFIQYVDQINEQQMIEISENIEAKYPSYLASNQQAFQTYTNDLALAGMIIQIKKDEIVVYDGFILNQTQISTMQQPYADKEKELTESLDSSYSIYEKTLDIDNQSYLLQIYSYRPLFINEAGYQHLHSLNNIVMYISLGILLVAICLSVFLSSLFTKPVTFLIGKIKDIEKGNTVDMDLQGSKIREYVELEQAFKQLSQSLKYQKEMRKNMSTDLSHELRTPLTALALTLENIEEGIWQYDKTHSKSIIEEVNRLQSLIEDLHELEQVDVGMHQLIIQKVDIKRMIEHCIDVFKATIEAKKLVIETLFECEIIDADPKRIEQVIMNLLSNAIKYTKTDGKIFIAVTKTKKEAIISIKDNGIGISKQEQNDIFRRFYRAHDNQQAGVGIGLAIVKEIVSAHDGEVLLFSEKGIGTEIIVVLKNQENK